jgi:glycosyltransferase involved in cell wall biosynthesis
VLLSAYACHPHEGSEPAVGWNWLLGIAQRHDVWLLTEAQRYASPVAEAIAAFPSLAQAVRVIGIPRERHAERWLGAAAYYRTYRRWQQSAYEYGAQLHRMERFDLVHQLNMIGYREPGYLWQLDAPFIWGPLGGYAQFAWRYLPATGWRGAVTLGARNVANAVQMRGSSRVRRAMERAQHVIAATRTDRDAIQRHYGRVATVIAETGCEAPMYDHVRTLQPGQILRVLWCGLLLPRKALSLALRAVARASEQAAIDFHIYGHTGDAAAERRLAKRLGVAHACTFHGRVPRHQMLDAMCRAHVLLFPSLLEATSATVPEALSLGLPVLCHRICGQGDAVDDSCGVRVPVETPERSVKGFARALVDLGEHPERLRQLSDGAIRRARTLRWHHKATALDMLYRDAAESTSAGAGSG